MTHLAFALSLALIASTPLAASQVSAEPSASNDGTHLQHSLPFVELEHEQTTGWVSNDGAHASIVASLHVEVPNADSLRLFFSEVELAGGSLRIVSLKDEAEQVLDRRGLDEWRQSTAWFNGDAVLLDLILEPGTGPALVTIGSLKIGVAPLASKSQCGPTDDRVPSSDPRVARLLPSGCTAWMINDCAKCFLSAGHCGTGNNMVEFNVPFSNNNGSWNHPPPSDQYSIDSASMQSQNSFGADWMYFGTFTNSTTGLSAFETQGDSFTLASPPSPTGNTIRITGHGSDFSPNGTYNQIQQTHSGPFTSAGNPLNYKVDTEGGNSGSPVIWDDENVAIGIHTNAGCSTSGAGANSGTNINNGNLQAALANPLGACASGGVGGPFEDLGQGLFSLPFFVAPELKGCGTLDPGTSYSVIQSMPPSFGALTASNLSVLIVGNSEANLPLEGGTLVPALDFVAVLPIVTAGTSSTIELTNVWPASAPSGTTVYAQFWTPISSVFGTSVIASNGLKLTSP